jgi:hypothetical protein
MDERFSQSREAFEEMLVFLEGDQAAGLTHAELEDQLQSTGRELLRQLYQDHLDLRAERERRLGQVQDASGVAHRCVESGHDRGLITVFGPVVVSRLAYRHQGTANLYPADASLNLPDERHSHGLRRLVAIESVRGSFDDARAALSRACGVGLGKRQVEQLARRAAADVDSFYNERSTPAGDDGDVMVLSADGKGIVMRPDALRPATAAAAVASATKLATRLSKGEKRNRKRMAEVGAVYEITPQPRSPTDIIGHHDQTEPAKPPAAKHKWLTASIVDDAASVIARLFDEAERRDPAHRRVWVALVDGNTHQIDRIQTEAARRHIKLTVLCDFVHVLEYLWKAAWCFFVEADPAAETWVQDKALTILQGHATVAAAAIRRTATNRHLDPGQRKAADACADYLLNKRRYLDYSTALANGWPIATGVIEGACRHLVKDRLDITGARWGLAGAEAILKLRALHSNGDFDDYWRHHLSREHDHVHKARYAKTVIPQAA